MWYAFLKRELPSEILKKTETQMDPLPQGKLTAEVGLLPVFLQTGVSALWSSPGWNQTVKVDAKAVCLRGKFWRAAPCGWEFWSPSLLTCITLGLCEVIEGSAPSEKVGMRSACFRVLQTAHGHYLKVCEAGACLAAPQAWPSGARVHRTALIPK